MSKIAHFPSRVEEIQSIYDAVDLRLVLLKKIHIKTCVQRIFITPLVDKIGSPGKPATPLSGLMSGLIRKNRLPARIRGWAGTATGRHIHVVHISHTPTERAHTDPKNISFEKKENAGRAKQTENKQKMMLPIDIIT